MALLRNRIGLCYRAVKFFSTERPILNPELSEKIRKRKVSVKFLSEGNIMLNKWITEKSVIKSDEWAAARNELLSLPEYEILESTVDMTMVNLCLEAKRTDLAMSYLELLWDKQKMNLLSMTTYLRLSYQNTETKLEKRSSDYLLAIYDVVREKYPVMDGSTGESCILGILMTERWKESLEIMNLIKFSCNPKIAVYSALISTAFNKDEPDIAWSYLHEIGDNLIPGIDAYAAYLKFCIRNFNSHDLEYEILKIFTFWKDREIHPHVETIHAYENAMKDLGWETARTSIRKTGICQRCSHQLFNFNLSMTDYKKLAHLICDRAIVGTDVYQKTTPKELKYFLQFIEENKPWDIVIDGLNVGYLTHDRKSAGLLITKTVELCVGMGKKVLLLGRQHLVKVRDFETRYIKKYADVFLADNRSADDPYLLYATLSSGPHTMFVSRDLMRQHKFVLEDEYMMKIFKHWQITHQYIPVGIKTKNGTLSVKLLDPPKYLPVIQNYVNGWHVPYTFETNLRPENYEPPELWACFRKKQEENLNISQGLKNI